MKRFLTMSAIALLGALALAPFASARPPRVFIGGGFGYPGRGWDYDPYVYPYPDYAYPGPANYTGEVKIKTLDRDASVYVDDGLIGQMLHKTKDISLPAGNHQIEVRNPDGSIVFQQTVNVIPGRTIDLRAM